MIPFLKWPGGKRWFVAQRANLLPDQFGRYIEPFLGSGAVFFHLKPKRALLADVNAELIATYRAVRDNPGEVERLLRFHHRRHSAEHYYATRDAHLRSTVRRAAQFIYLNRTCFNGIYRVNQAGVFNVPIGTKTAVVFGTDDFSEVARRLRGRALAVSDFEDVINSAKPGDLVFADPPYTVRHNNNGFVKYNDCLFSWDDQERLAASLRRATRRRVKVVATNAEHPEVRKLYPQPIFQFVEVERYSAISSNSSSRRAYRELVIRANCD